MAKTSVVRAAAAALALAGAVPASAHEFDCEDRIGVVQAGADGTPLVGADGLPVFTVRPAQVFTIHAYPALVGSEITLRNLASAPSVVTFATTGMANVFGDKVKTFGPSFGPGFTLDVGASATMARVVSVVDQEECETTFGAGSPDAPSCSGTAEDAFLVEHDAGSVECRARIVCGAPQGQPPPPPPPPEGCASVWGGPKTIALSLPSDWSFGASDLALDPSCNVSVAGIAFQLTSIPPFPAQAFVARLDAAGTQDQGVAFGGGRQDEVAVAADAAGNRFVAWDAGVSRVAGEPTVSKIGPDGAEVWRMAIQMPSTPPPGFVPLSAIRAIAVDGAGNPVVASLLTDNGGGWVAKLDGATGATLWSVFPFGDAIAGARDVAVDAAGNVFLAGSTAEALPGNAGFGTVSMSNPDAFVAKLAPDGTLVKVTQLGTANSDGAAAVGVDAAGNAYAGGVTSQPGPDFSTFFDGFLAQVDAAGDWTWMRSLSSFPDHALIVNDVAVDAAGDAWVVGMLRGAIDDQTSAGDWDAFVARYDATGQRLWVKQFGTAGWDEAAAVAVDALGNGYVLSGRTVIKLAPDGSVL